MTETNLPVLSYAQMGERQIPIYGSIEEPLFKAKDVAEVLTLSNVTDMVSRVDNDEVTKLNLGSLQGETWFLTEAGLYEVFFQSRKPAAKEFKRVVKGILRQLRITGEVSVRPTVPVKRRPTPSKTRVDAVIAAIKGVSEIFSLDDVSKQRMYNKFAEDYDLPQLEYTPANGGREAITNLLKMHGIVMQAKQANKILEREGYLVLREAKHKNNKISHYYEVSDKGKAYGDNFQSEFSPKETQPLWYVNKFVELLPLFKGE